MDAAPDTAFDPEKASREDKETPMGFPLQLLAFAAIAATVTGTLAALAARRDEGD